MKLPPARWSPAALTELINSKKVNAYSMAMNEWKNIIMLFKTPIHVLVCKVGHKTYVLLSRFPLFIFWSELKNYTHFRLIQFLKNTIAWHFITFTSPSSKLEFVYPPCCGVEEQMLIFSSGLTLGRVKGSWPQVKHRTHLKDSCVS